MTTTEFAATQRGVGGYADVNGINLYFERHGPARSGTGAAPLILLHGGLASGEMFGPVLPVYAERREVILVDLQGHGRTADIDRPLDIRLMADDIAALIEHLGLGRPDVMGYSLGGGVALFTASRHPDRVRKLVSASAHAKSDAIYAEMRAQQAQVGSAAIEFLKPTPMFELYERVAPRPEDFGRLLDKIGASMAVEFDFRDAVRDLAVPTLIACADADMAPPRHYVELFELLGGGQRDGGWMGEGRPAGGHALAVIPNETHYSVGVSPVLAAAAISFLGAGGDSAAGQD